MLEGFYWSFLSRSDRDGFFGSGIRQEHSGLDGISCLFAILLDYGFDVEKLEKWEMLEKKSLAMKQPYFLTLVSHQNYTSPNP